MSALPGAGIRHPSWLDMTSTVITRSSDTRENSLVSSPEVSMHPLPNLPQIRSTGDFRQAVQAAADTSLDTFYDDASDNETDSTQDEAWDVESDGSNTDIDSLDMATRTRRNDHGASLDMQGNTQENRLQEDRLSQLRMQLQRNQPASIGRPGKVSGHVVSSSDVASPYLCLLHFGYQVTLQQQQSLLRISCNTLCSCARGYRRLEAAPSTSLSFEASKEGSAPYFIVSGSAAGIGSASEY
jgi:hypothetical protein